MRIVQICPSSGDSFYCENCLRDAALVKALRRLGHDVLMVPLYLPLAADRTEADSKGGHLARRSDGQLILRESAQCPQRDTAAFRDIGRYRYFNTNNLWLDLAMLQQTMAGRGHILGLPLICNRKHLDPRDENGRSAGSFFLKAPVVLQCSIYSSRLC